MTDLRKAVEMKLDALEDVARKTPTTHVRAGKAMIGDKEHVALWFDDSSDPIQQADYINQTKPEKILALIEALRQALAMEKFSEVNQKIEEALKQPEQKPVAIVNEGMGGIEWLSKPLPDDTPLYTAPPNRKWERLTPQELNAITEKVRTWNSYDITDIYFAIESELKKKNGFMG